MGTSLIRRQRHGDIQLLQLARGKGNALNLTLLRELLAALADSREAAALVLTGEERFFCTGLDLVELPQLDRPAMSELLECLEDAFVALFGFPRPVVAALNGHAVAGGCVLALCSDQRVMARGAFKIGLNELAHGIGLPASVQEIARAQTSPGWLAEVALGAALYDPETALRRGLVHELAEPEQVLARALALAGAWAAHPAEPFAATKNELRGPVLETIRLRRRRDDGRAPPPLAGALARNRRTAARGAAGRRGGAARGRRRRGGRGPGAGGRTGLPAPAAALRRSRRHRRPRRGIRRLHRARGR